MEGRIESGEGLHQPLGGQVSYCHLAVSSSKLSSGNAAENGGVNEKN
jgi:hypothetical protein